MNKMNDNDLEKIGGGTGCIDEMADKYKEVGIKYNHHTIKSDEYIFYGKKVPRDIAISIIDYRDKLKSLGLNDRQIESALAGVANVVYKI